MQQRLELLGRPLTSVAAVPVMSGGQRQLSTRLRPLLLKEQLIDRLLVAPPSTVSVTVEVPAAV